MNHKYAQILALLTMGSFQGEDPGFGAGRFGQCYAANEASIQEAIKSGQEFVAANDGNLATSPMGLSQVLTNYAAGVQDPESLDALLEQIAPSVPSGSILFSYLQEDETAQFQTRQLGQIARPTGGEFPIAQVPTGVEDHERCQNIGLVSYLDINQGGLIPLIQEREVKRLRDIIRRSQIAYAVALLDAAATDGGSVNWGSSTSDPDNDVLSMIDAGGTDSGVDNNTVLFGQGVWLKRRRAYSQPGRFNGASLAQLMLKDMPEVYQADKVINSRSRYRSDNSTLTRVLDNKIYTYESMPGLTLRDPSNIKRVTYVTEQGGIRVWVEVQSHRVKITVDAFETIIITRSKGIQKKTITYS